VRLDLGQAPVCPGVPPDGVAFRSDSLDNIGEPADGDPTHEERRQRTMTLEYVQQGWGEVGVWTIIESQRHAVSTAPPTIRHVDQLPRWEDGPSSPPRTPQLVAYAFACPCDACHRPPLRPCPVSLEGHGSRAPPDVQGTTTRAAATRLRSARPGCPRARGWPGHERGSRLPRSGRRWTWRGAADPEGHASRGSRRA
jgi:hypothetical protein